MSTPILLAGFADSGSQRVQTTEFRLHSKSNPTWQAGYKPNLLSSVIVAELVFADQAFPCGHPQWE